jgi:DNA/RNA endonuclease YhcR with UshA esterase domain
MTGRISSWWLAALLAGSAVAVELPKNLDDDYLTENKSNTLHGKSAPQEPGQEAREKLALTTPQLGKSDALDALDTPKLMAMTGKIVTVQGTVVKTFHSEKSDTRFFNFDKKGEKFEFIIFKGGMKNFDKTGDPLDFYQGKKLQITGVLSVSPKGKPQIIVTKPEQITIVR